MEQAEEALARPTDTTKKQARSRLSRKGFSMWTAQPNNITYLFRSSSVVGPINDQAEFIDSETKATLFRVGRHVRCDEIEYLDYGPLTFLSRVSVRRPRVTVQCIEYTAQGFRQRQGPVKLSTRTEFRVDNIRRRRDQPSGDDPMKHD
ncbi:hypothetical protein E4U32_001752 [Claviceps aff. humidiphila group G2b]|nr:hypothetical protein E4U32_001752 [Claviceps aff. humidiphila group G2b]